MKTPTFIDRVRLFVQAGNGGNGVNSFKRRRHLLKGKPDGGDGGRGGDLQLRADRDEVSLLRLFYAPHCSAQHGKHGSSNRMQGGNAQATIVKVPCGTEVRDAPSGQLLGDLAAHGEMITVARGGKGGLGNAHWRGAGAPPAGRTAGANGERRELLLELKLVSDVGLVGYPNAGKSTLLRAISHAHPKVASYPFTTLHPVLGTLVCPDYTMLKIADVPGLVEGAHEGVGLGHSFLRHIERARFLVFVVDMAGSDGRDPGADLQSLREELRLHNEALAEVPSVVTANKMDVPRAEENLAAFSAHTGCAPIPISATTGRGLDTLTGALCEHFSEQRRARGAGKRSRGKS